MRCARYALRALVSLISFRTSAQFALETGYFSHFISVCRISQYISAYFIAFFIHNLAEVILFSLRIRLHRYGSLAEELLLLL